MACEDNIKSKNCFVVQNDVNQLYDIYFAMATYLCLSLDSQETMNLILTSLVDILTQIHIAITETNTAIGEMETAVGNATTAITNSTTAIGETETVINSNTDVLNALGTLIGFLGGLLGTIDTIADMTALSTGAGQFFVVVLGYNAPNDGGGGLFYFDSSSVATADGGTIFDPDSGPGKWLRVQSGLPSVKWFGAYADGTTDDTPQILAANTVFSNIYIPAGLYSIGTSLTLTGSPEIDGTLYVESGQTLTVDCEVKASDRLLFTGPGSVVTGPGFIVNDLQPSWFGALPTPVLTPCSITAASTTLTVPDSSQIPPGAQIIIDGAGTAPTMPTNVMITPNTTAATTYNYRVSSVTALGGISESTANVAVTNSVAAPNQNNTISWTASVSSDTVLYLVYRDGVLVGMTPSTSFLDSAQSISLPFNTDTTAPTAALASPQYGRHSTYVRSILTGTTVEVETAASNTATNQKVYIESTDGIHRSIAAIAESISNGATTVSPINLPGGLFVVSETIDCYVPLVLNGVGSSTEAIYSSTQLTATNQFSVGTTLYQIGIYINLLLFDDAANTADYTGLNLSNIMLKSNLVGGNLGLNTLGDPSYILRFQGRDLDPTVINYRQIVLKNVGFQGANAMRISHGTNTIITGCHFNGGLVGILQENDAGMSTQQWANVSITDTTFTGHYTRAIYSENAYKLRISACSFAGTVAASAVYLFGASNCIISDCTFDNCTGSIYLEDTFNVIIDSSDFQMNSAVSGLSAIEIDGTNDTHITNSTFTAILATYTGCIRCVAAGSPNYDTLITGNTFDLAARTSGADICIRTNNAGGTNTMMYRPLIKSNKFIPGNFGQTYCGYLDTNGEFEMYLLKQAAGKITAQNLVALSTAPAYSATTFTMVWRCSSFKDADENGVETGFVEMQFIRSDKAAAGTAGQFTAASSTETIASQDYGGTNDDRPLTALTPNAASGSSGANITISVAVTDATVNQTYWTGVLATRTPGITLPVHNYATTEPLSLSPV